MKRIADFFRDPSVKGLDVDDSDRLLVHSQVLANKPMLKKVFADFHQAFDRLDKIHLSGDGIRVEIGAGVAPIKNSFPDVMATDIVSGVGIDQVLDAENMNLPDGSVRVLFGQNCFHHFPNPSRFFKEAERVLAPGGGIILLEPYYGPLATLLFTHMFHSEGYDKNYPSWETPATGPMNGANQALSYIIFNRDRAVWERSFPRLSIVHKETCNNYLVYLLSGGLNFRQLVPNWATPPLQLAQRILSPLDRWLALHHIVVIQKRV